MMRYIRDLRLIPIALIASACLLALKLADIALHGSDAMTHDTLVAGDAGVSVVHAMPDATSPPGKVASWAAQMFNFPDGHGSASPASSSPNILPQLPKIAERDSGDITGSVTTPPSDPANTGSTPAPIGKDKAGAAIIPTDGTTMPTGAERAILERLQERREELDKRARELDIRESLIQSAEKRMDAKLAEMKDTEDRIKAELGQKDAAQAAQLKGLVTMYENMKARDAAKIFNGLDTNVLIEVASQINPRQMADILAQMSPDVAERLTVELVNKVQQGQQATGAAGLPKIEGQPIAQ